MSRYEDAVARGYDGPSPAEERRMRNRYSCSDGMCGATDCSRCYGEGAGLEDDGVECDGCGESHPEDTLHTFGRQRVCDDCASDEED